MVNKVRVNIAGAPYAIATTDSESYITSLAKKLDEDITKLLDDQRQPLGDQGGGVLRDGLSGRIPQEHRQCRKHAQPDPGLHRRCSPGKAGRG